MIARLLPIALISAGPAFGDGLLHLPDTAELAQQDAEFAGYYLIPTGPWADQGMPAFEANGSVNREVWQIRDFTGGTGVLLAVLSGQLEEAGFEPIFTCTTRVCGGFDFRFALDIVPEPEMHVNLADFGYYAARRDTPDGPEYAALVVSEGGGAGFVQSVFVAPQSSTLAEVVTQSSRSPDQLADDAELAAPRADSVLGALQSAGRSPLPGIQFAYGSVELTDPDLPVLDELAGYLTENPEIRLTLVGHTDAEGSLASNIDVSRARAATVRRVLIDRYGIAPDRLTAEGVGFLMPLALNTTQEGRDMNRRVEAVVINTQ
ncbi:MAG: OmpA family protein [Pseudomonadota bacterium]